MFFGVFGLWGSPAGGSTVIPPTGAADDNIAVAVRAMKQVAVLWVPDGVDEFGQPTHGTPVAIDCRWEVLHEEFITPAGDTEVSKAKLIVDRDIEVKSILMLGELDSEVADTPSDNDAAWEVRCFKSTPDFRGTKFLREVYL